MGLTSEQKSDEEYSEIQILGSPWSPRLGLAMCLVSHS